MLQKSSSDGDGATSTIVLDKEHLESEECEINDNVAVLLITANVGSLFEDPERLLVPWLTQFFQKVEKLQPYFIALHLQEVGGKTYEKSMESVKEFIDCICKSPVMMQFSMIRIFVDEDYNSAQNFTALGNLYFGHNQLHSVRIWNFVTHSWSPADGRDIYTGNIEDIATKEKSKFPQHFFPECKWSRKGFMRTRWELNGTVIDLVNIHLFHDASNLAACEEFPSVYCKTRRRALVHSLERFHMDEHNGLAPYFIFGDFNFRCDTQGVVKELTQDLSTHRIEGIKKDSTKVHYRNDAGDNILTIGKKEFNHADHQLKFKETWLKKYDRELDVLKDVLNEFEIQFDPSYPYEEDPEMPCDYMSTRCPSWCDRILMSPHVVDLIIHDVDNPYSVMGKNICMGDHKPVYLKIQLKPNQGTYRCCNCCFRVNNKSSSCNDSAAPAFCPYKITTYNEILIECMSLNAENIYPHKGQKVYYTDGYTNSNLSSTNAKDSKTSNTSYNNSKIIGTTPISINVTNSENLHVSWYPQILEDGIKTDSDCIRQAIICPECRNIINHPTEHYCRLTPKQLSQTNNIIVNKIDTQYLSTVFDMSMHCQDPYTPESLESHSPMPEVTSLQTTTLSDDIITKSDGACDTKLGMQMNNSSSLRTDSSLSVEYQRGVVTPGQLKSRLENLQMHSMNNLNETISAAEERYVGDVGSIDQKTSVKRKNDASCLPKCCNIH